MVFEDVENNVENQLKTVENDLQVVLTTFYVHFGKNFQYQLKYLLNLQI